MVNISLLSMKAPIRCDLQVVEELEEVEVEVEEGAVTVEELCQ